MYVFKKVTKRYKNDWKSFVSADEDDDQTEVKHSEPSDDFEINERTWQLFNFFDIRTFPYIVLKQVTRANSDLSSNHVFEILMSTETPSCQTPHAYKQAIQIHF